MRLKQTHSELRVQLFSILAVRLVKVKKGLLKLKDTEEVKKALEVLKENAETDFEKLSVSRLETALFNPPRVEVVDENHQKFNGIIYYRVQDGHYHLTTNIYRAVYDYYNGEIPEGYSIHHIDLNPANNDVENLQLLSRDEHAKIHKTVNGETRQKSIFICSVCGKEFESYAHFGNKRFCSNKCRSYEKHHQIVRKCDFCGVEFAVGINDKNRFCSIKCSKQAYSESQQVRRVCPICGTDFVVRQSSKKKTCSRYCAGVLRGITMKKEAAKANNDSEHNDSVIAGYSAEEYSERPKT